MLRAVVEGWQRLDQPVPWIVETARKIRKTQFILDCEAVGLGGGDTTIANFAVGDTINFNVRMVQTGGAMGPGRRKQ